jgi:hypothetical protein
VKPNPKRACETGGISIAESKLLDDDRERQEEKKPKEQNQQSNIRVIRQSSRPVEDMQALISLLDGQPTVIG